jgi:FMN phosphatase YigB (HAD superfamily)
MVDVHVFSCTEGVMKPDRRIFEVATTRLGVEANECIYIGDGADDELEGAQAVGMDAILLRPGDTSPPQRLSARARVAESGADRSRLRAVTKGGRHQQLVPAAAPTARSVRMTPWFA